jgi:hypothetical protein
VGHSILVIAWHLLSRGEPYTDLGADDFVKGQAIRPTGTSWSDNSSAWATGHPGANSRLTGSQMLAGRHPQGIFTRG